MSIFCISLLRHKISKNDLLASVVNSNAKGPGLSLVEAGGLDLLQGEAASSPLLHVVPEGGAPGNGVQAGQGAGSNAGSLKLLKNISKLSID